MAARYSAMAADCAWHAKTTSLQVGTVAVALDARSEKIRCTILKSEVRTRDRTRGAWRRRNGPYCIDG